MIIILMFLLAGVFVLSSSSEPSTTLVLNPPSPSMIIFAVCLLWPPRFYLLFSDHVTFRAWYLVRRRSVPHQKGSQMRKSSRSVRVGRGVIGRMGWRSPHTAFDGVMAYAWLFLQILCMPLANGIPDEGAIKRRVSTEGVQRVYKRWLYTKVPS